jgi:thiamine kinase-like enzyme
MQDKILEALAGSIDLADRFVKQQREVSEMLSGIDMNSKDINPELKRLHDEALIKVGAANSDLDRVREDLKKFDI